MPVVHKKNGKQIEYDYYKEHQGRKGRTKGDKLMAHAPSRVKGFEKVFRNAVGHLLPGSILCLGARTGCEVRAARNLGWTAIGIDIYPVLKDESVVMEMDWHDMKFPDNSFDNAYTNSIDHCFDLEKLAREVRRVLKPGGVWICQAAGWQAMAKKDDQEKYMRQSSNYLFWHTAHDLGLAICEYGFELRGEWVFKRKWDTLALRSTKGE